MIVRSRVVPAALVISVLAALAAGATLTACLETPSFTTLEDALAADSGASDEDASTEPVDGATSEPDPDAAQAACLAVCAAPATCEAGTCTFACSPPTGPGPAGGGCGPVSCPPGVPCQVKCIGNKACGDVACGTASSCQVECNGDTACGKVTSASPSTNVQCSGKNACKDPRCDGDTCAIQCGLDACQYQSAQCCATKCTFNGLPGRCK